MKLFSILILILSALLLTPLPSLRAPWRTIQHAADSLAPGVMVYARGGVY